MFHLRTLTTLNYFTMCAVKCLREENVCEDACEVKSQVRGVKT
jgi:hypothetical protein